MTAKTPQPPPRTDERMRQRLIHQRHVGRSLDSIGDPCQCDDCRFVRDEPPPRTGTAEPRPVREET